MQFRKIEHKRGEDDGHSKFVKLNDGDSVKGVCRGEVYEFHMKWENNKSETVGPMAIGAKPRFRINFVVLEGSKLTAKILEFGPQISNQFYELSQEYDLSKTMVKITRKGEKLETEYIVIPVPQPVNMMEMSKVELNILEHKEKPPQQDTPSEDWSEDSDTIPF